MSRSISVAAVQLRARDRGAFAGAFENIVDTVARAARNADLLVLPEGTIPDTCSVNAPLDAREIDDALGDLATLRGARRNRYRRRRGDRGARRCSVMPPSSSTPTVPLPAAPTSSSSGTSTGAGSPAENGSLRYARASGSLGVLVCADGRLPTISRALVDDGAELLVMPTAWVTSGRDPSALENVQADLLARVRAYENRRPVRRRQQVRQRARHGRLLRQEPNRRRRWRDRRDCERARARNAARARSTLGSATGAARRAAQPAPRSRGAGTPLRIAIAYDSLPADIDARLELLDDAYALSPHDPQRLARSIAIFRAARGRRRERARSRRARSLSARGLRAHRWTTELRPPWLERIARARALELRLYVVVFDRRERRAFAVDPDGTIDRRHVRRFSPRELYASIHARLRDDRRAGHRCRRGSRAYRGPHRSAREAIEGR